VDLQTNPYGIRYAEPIPEYPLKAHQCAVRLFGGFAHEVEHLVTIYNRQCPARDPLHVPFYDQFEVSLQNWRTCSKHATSNCGVACCPAQRMRDEVVAMFKDFEVVGVSNSTILRKVSPLMDAQLIKMYHSPTKALMFTPFSPRPARAVTRTGVDAPASPVHIALDVSEVGGAECSSRSEQQHRQLMQIFDLLQQAPDALTQDQSEQQSAAQSPAGSDRSGCEYPAEVSQAASSAAETTNEHQVPPLPESWVHLMYEAPSDTAAGWTIESLRECFTVKPLYCITFFARCREWTPYDLERAYKFMMALIVGAQEFRFQFEMVSIAPVVAQLKPLTRCYGVLLAVSLDTQTSGSDHCRGTLRHRHPSMQLWTGSVNLLWGVLCRLRLAITVRLRATTR
jgi:hypothetical protein